MNKHLLKLLFTSCLTINPEIQNITNSLDTSETCIVMKPKSSHLLAPFISFPNPGMKIINEMIKENNKKYFP